MDILALIIPSIILHWPNFTIFLGKEYGNSSFSDSSSLIQNIIGLKDVMDYSSFTFAFIEKLVNRKEIKLTSPTFHFVFFGEPNEFRLLISKFSNQQNYSWYIVVNESSKPQLPRWMELLRNMDLAFDSEIFFAVWKMNLLQVFEVYRICSHCPNTVQEICSFIGNRLLQGVNCNKDLFERRKNLQETTIEVVAVDVLPFMSLVSKTNDGVAQVSGGLFGTIFAILCDQLNATYNLKILHGYRYGSFNNGSWNGMLGYLYRNEVDMTISELSLTEDRLRSIEYTTSFASVGRKIYIRKIMQDKNINWGFYSAPFSPLLHLSVLFSSIFMTLSLLLDQKFIRLNNRFTLSESFWVSFSTICQKGAQIIPSGRSSKIIFLVFSFTFLIIFCVYSATLISQLAVVPPLAIPFKNLQDFIVKAKNWKAGPIKGDLTQIYMEKTCPELLKKGENAQCELLVQVWNKVIRSEKENLPLSFNDGLARVLQEKFAFIATSLGVRNHILNNLSEKSACSVLEMDGDYMASNLAFGLRKNFPYKKLFNYKILQLRKSGIIKLLEKRWLPQQKQCLDSHSSTFKDATIYDVGVAPMVWSVGSISSLLILFMEIICRRNKNDFY